MAHTLDIRRIHARLVVEVRDTRNPEHHTVNPGRHSHHRHRSHGNLVQSLCVEHADSLVEEVDTDLALDRNDHKPDSLGILA